MAGTVDSECQLTGFITLDGTVPAGEYGGSADKPRLISNIWQARDAVQQHNR